MFRQFVLIDVVGMVFFAVALIAFDLAAALPAVPAAYLLGFQTGACPR